MRLQGIYKYDSLELQRIFKLKVKPEPWLHIAITIDQSNRLLAAVFVWDTRKVVGQGRVSTNSYVQNYHTNVAISKMLDGKLKRAVDNHEPLVGLKGDKRDIEAIQEQVTNKN